MTRNPCKNVARKKIIKKSHVASTLGISNLLVNHDAMYVIEKLHKHKFDGYIVGGGVRDLLLNKPPKDFDIVTNATPEQIRKIFKHKALIIGKRFKLVHVVFDNINPEKFVHNRPIIERHIIEISTYRSAAINNQHLNERGRITQDNNYGTQEEDAYRRDFTINALYYDPIKEVILDYHNAISDIKKGLIKIIGDPKARYTEDPVRMLRAVRLSIKLDLQIDRHSLAPLNQLKSLLTHENYGRLYEEMLKILLSGYSYACVQQFTVLKLPKKVFVLFDKLFFKAIPDKFALKVLEKTDNRLKETSDVSIVFILSSLLWPMLNKTCQNILHDTNVSVLEALNESINHHKDFIYSIGISKPIFKAIQSVWLLQLTFEHPETNMLKTILTIPRFRQAWHLFALRHEFNQVNPELYTWWNEFISSLPTQRAKLYNTLPNIL